MAKHPTILSRDMQRYPKEFLQRIPKTDLHLHLDGSLRIQTLIELANSQGVELPSNTEAGLKATVFKDKYASLDEYLKGFAYTCAVMRNTDALHRISYELMMDNAAEGVRYIEVRFAPQLLMSSRLGMDAILEAVDRGLKQARDELNEKKLPSEPGYDYGIIVCAMRFFTKGFSEYYADLYRIHSYSTQQDVIRTASLELAKAAAHISHNSSIQLVGFDLAGSEYGYPASEHKESYEFAHKHFLRKTVHAGEAFGPESIFQAVTKIKADRIGHGLHLFEEDKIHHIEPKNRADYIRRLVNYLAEHRITIEVCLSSNQQTTPSFSNLDTHSLGKMLKHQLSVTLCTDNRLVSNTTVTHEYELATKHFDLEPKELRNLVIAGFKRSFFYRPYTEKRAYVREMIAYYDKLAAEYGIQP